MGGGQKVPTGAAYLEIVLRVRRHHDFLAILEVHWKKRNGTVHLIASVRQFLKFQSAKTDLPSDLGMEMDRLVSASV